MNVGIIVYSQTGHTKSVAESLAEKLGAKGYDVEVEEVKVQGEVQPGSKDIMLLSNPSVEPYDVVIFAAPVQAFSLALPMSAYLDQIDSLDGKKLACLITKQLPFKWTGGNHAVRQIKKKCAAKGGDLSQSGIIFWAESKRQESTKQVLESLSNFV